MRHVPALAVLSTVFLLEGCSTTKTITLHSQTKMVTGEQMSCIYHSDNLYCVSPLIKTEAIERLQLMAKVVSVVHSEEKESEMKEGGAFATRFGRKLAEYSLWNCTNTGVADPAIQCVLLREADQKLVSKQEQEIALNESGEKKLQSGLTEQDVITKCGTPVEQKSDSISHTLYFRAAQPGHDVEVRFSTLRTPNQLDQIESTQESTPHDFIPGGIFWNNYINIGKTDEERVPDIRQHFPCVLK